MQEPPSSRGPRRLIVLSVALIVLVTAGYAATFWLLGPRCANRVVERVRSPDGRYDLVIFARNCGATTAYSTQVSVLPAAMQLPDRAGNAFRLAADVPVRAEWESGAQAIVHYPLGLRVAQQSPTVGDVRIRYVGERVRTPEASAALDSARGTAERRYRQHFAEQRKGFSVGTLRARRSWFTPRLYEAMLADMSHEGEIGYIDFDPFTAAQDDASSFAVASGRSAHDTVLVDVTITYPPGSSDRSARVTLAMVPSPVGWQIGNFIYADHDLAGGLLRAAQGDSSHVSPDSATRADDSTHVPR